MRLQVVTPWYPDYASAYSGIFVQKQVEAVRRAGVHVEVEVPEIFPAPAGPIPDAVTTAMATLAKRDAEALYRRDGSVTWVPSPVPSRSGYVGRAHAFADSLRAKRRLLPVEADVTHAHLGVPTGWAVSEITEGPLVVTEHQSTLSTVFADPAGVAAYREAIERADAFFCVSRHLRNQVADAVGAKAAEKIEIVPNIVDLTDIPYVTRATLVFRRWIYVGTLAFHKGVQDLLRSFAIYRRRFDAESTLVIVGDGPHRSWVERFVAAKGLAGAVDLAGAQPHTALGHYLAGADVMIHLSPSETFGIASLEGIGSGLPVISMRNGGADTAWGDMETECGLLLEVGESPERVAEAVAHLRDSPERLRPDLGRSMVEERYGPEVIAGRLIDVYRACAG